jgi:hypothetical protein
MEVWKDVVGYEGIYQVSNLGRVQRRIRKKSGRVKGFTRGVILKPEQCINGYLRVRLYFNGIGKHCLIHRLVGMAFIDNPNGYPEINHKDEVKQNNSVNNLEWCTGKYNSNYGTGRIRALANTDIKKKTANTDYEKIAQKTRKKVKQIDLSGKIITTWEGQKQAAQLLGIRQGAISNCCVGRTNTAGGYKWQYA